MTWRTETLTLEVGQSLVMYTDGVIEAQYALNEEFGEAQLIAAVSDTSAQQIQQSIQAAVTSFVGDSPQFDDLTLVIAAQR